MNLETQLVNRYPELTICHKDIKSSVNLLKEVFLNNRKLLICGNGGSSSDSDHIVGELMKGFRLNREIMKNDFDDLESLYGKEIAIQMQNSLQRGLPAISLNGNFALLTAFSNDRDFEFYFAQQVLSLGQKEDALLCISTSGNSINVVQAARIAKFKGLKVISLTGEKDSLLSELSDITIKVPKTETFEVQELHLPIYHDICLKLEDYFFIKE